MRETDVATPMGTRNLFLSSQLIGRFHDYGVECILSFQCSLHRNSKKYLNGNLPSLFQGNASRLIANTAARKDEGNCNQNQNKQDSDVNAIFIEVEGKGASGIVRRSQ